MATTTQNERVCAHTLKRQVILTHHVHMANVTICAKDNLSSSLACKRCRGCCWSTRGPLVGHFLSSSLTNSLSPDASVSSWYSLHCSARSLQCSPSLACRTTLIGADPFRAWGSAGLQTRGGYAHPLLGEPETAALPASRLCEQTWPNDLVCTRPAHWHFATSGGSLLCKQLSIQQRLHGSTDPLPVRGELWVGE